MSNYDNRGEQYDFDMLTRRADVAFQLRMMAAIESGGERVIMPFAQWQALFARLEALGWPPQRRRRLQRRLCQ